MEHGVAINGCINCLAMTAIIAVMCVPIQYYIPELYVGSKKTTLESHTMSTTNSVKMAKSWFLLDFPPLDLFFTVSLLLLTVVTYLCDWIQRKLMERRLLKLKQYMFTCLECLKVWDNRQEQLEATIQVVQNATSEYNLLLYLLLRHQQRLGGACRKPPSSYFSYETGLASL